MESYDNKPNIFDLLDKKSKSIPKNFLLVEGDNSVIDDSLNSKSNMLAMEMENMMRRREEKRKIEEMKMIEKLPEITYKYTINSNENSIIKLQNHGKLIKVVYQTNDHDIKMLIDSINGDMNSKGWDKVLNEKDITIHKKSVK